MSSDFENYIKQLQELELTENRSRLQNFCDLNKTTLSYFKNIWNTLQSILANKEISPSIVNMVDENMQVLVWIKTEYEKLKKSEIDSSCTSKAQHIGETIKSMSLADCKYVEKELQDLISDNKNKIEHRHKPSDAIDFCIKQLKEGNCDINNNLNLLEQIYLMPDYEDLFELHIKRLALHAKQESTLMKILCQCNAEVRAKVVDNPNITDKVRKKLLEDNSKDVLSAISFRGGQGSVKNGWSNGWTHSQYETAIERYSELQVEEWSKEGSGGCFSIIAIILSVSIALSFII